MYVAGAIYIPGVSVRCRRFWSDSQHRPQLYACAECGMHQSWKASLKVPHYIITTTTTTTIINNTDNTTNNTNNTLLRLDDRQDGWLTVGEVHCMYLLRLDKSESGLARSR